MTVSRDIEGSNIIIKPQDKASGMKSLSWGEKIKNIYNEIFYSSINLQKIGNSRIAPACIYRAYVNRFFQHSK